MKRHSWWLVIATALLSGSLAARASVPDFKTQEIETGLGVGYAVSLVDVNGDGKLDIVVVDKTRVVWYENPTWKRRNIIDNQTTPDNVCIAPYDIDADGQIDFALGAGWGNLSSTVPGPLYWLRRGKSLDENWTVYPIGEENSVHRMRWADIDGDGRAELIVAPLLGTKSSKEKNYMDVPIRTLAFKIPKDPAKDRWVPEVLDETLHVVHNFWPIPAEGRKGMDLLTASYEGVSLLKPDSDGKWKPAKLGEGNQDNPNSNRGSSEIKMGTLKGGRKVIATIEPWHGHQVVVYTPPEKPGQLWTRHVVDEQLKWGHAVWFADLDGDGVDELIIGVRDNLGMKPGEKCGVRIYQAEDGIGTKWTRTLVDEGGVAVEDLAAADLDGDGRIDIVAVGRQTKNARIYWNQGKK
jgi:FG-GAP-like repeat/FG-GAP repeat